MVFLKTSILIPLLIYSLFNQSNDLKVGDMAPNFSLKNIEGKSVSMENNSSIKGYILVFTSNSCPYSTLYEDRIISVHEKYASLGFPVIAIQPNNPKLSPEDSIEKMKEKKLEKKFPFPYLIDSDGQETAKAYGATNTPQVFIVQKNASNGFTIVYIGAIDNNSRNPNQASKRYVEQAIDELLADLPVSTPSTKAIGCTIKN